MRRWYVRGALGLKEFVLENAFKFSKFDRLKPKIVCSCLITKDSHVPVYSMFEKMMLEFVPCSGIIQQI